MECFPKPACLVEEDLADCDSVRWQECPKKKKKRKREIQCKRMQNNYLRLAILVAFAIIFL
jgi:hypothetical protein